ANDSGASTANTEKAVMAVLHRQAEAGIHRDVEAIAAILDPEYFHTNPDGTLMTRAQTLESYRQPTQFSFSAEELEDFKTILFGNTAIANARVVLHGKRGQDPFTSRYRVTYVLRRSGDSWKV